MIQLRRIGLKSREVYPRGLPWRRPQALKTPTHPGSLDRPVSDWPGHRGAKPRGSSQQSPRRRTLRPLCAATFAALWLTLGPSRAWADEGVRPWRNDFDIRQLVEAGGPVGVLLAALSVATVALSLEHLFSLRRNSVAPKKLARQIFELCQQRQFRQAADTCSLDRSLLAYVLAAGLAEVESGYAAVEKAMEDACARYAARLYRKIDYLSVIGTLAPMLGLLGTVWGMMMAFTEFAAKVNVQVTELAPGISRALVTTLLGLAVAIPAYAASAYFRNRADEAISLCTQLAEQLFSGYRREQAARRRRARTLPMKSRSAAQQPRAAFPSVAIEREKSA
jgi:biopolymer transport protein ExbB